MADEEALRQRLRRLFLEELDEHVSVLEQGAERLLECAPDLPAATVAGMFRAAHSLKGAAHAVGAGDVAAVCHELEDTLAALRDDSVRPEPQVLHRVAELTASASRAGADFRDGPEESKQAGAGPDVGGGGRPNSAPVGEGPPEPPRPGPARAPRPESARTGARPEHAATGPGATVRVPAETLDTLLEQAADLAMVGRRARSLVTRVASLESDLRRTDEALRHDISSLRHVLHDVPAEVPAAQVLDRIEARNRQAVDRVEDVARSAARDEGEWSSLLGQFSAAARRVRTVPFTDATSGLARVLRSSAEAAGKQARLVVEAADARIDKHLVATVHDVLGHLVRNAVDHGLEPPAARAAAGKDPTGTVRIEASLRSEGIAIAVTDDGQGVQEHTVRDAARRAGHDLADNRDVTEALFRAGFSTAPQVSTASGRGVGLDAVREAVERGGGTVTFSSTPGAGVRIGIVLPLSTSTLRAVLVRAAGELLALPSASVQRFLELGELSVVGGQEVATVQDSALPVVRLADVLGWSVPARETGRDRLRGLLVSDPTGPVVLVVEELLEERELVVRANPPRLAALATMLGTAQLDDGSLVLVLSPSACVRVGRSSRPARAREVTGPVAASRSVLLVEDTLTTRELERSVLETAGYSVLVAGDGAQAWELLQHRTVDAVVSDVAMPRMDGLALCRAIRSSARLGHLPVVLVTSRASEEDRRGGLEAGADAYLTKQGFDREELLHTLERLL